MRGWHPRRFWSDQSGAIAPSYAIAIFMLVGVAGVGFDYGRMVAMDSELQNAADQAALAGATQLDGSADAIDRAINAAKQYVVNRTIQADGDNQITLDEAGSIRFWKDRFKNEEAFIGEEAKYIEVTVDDRNVTYALTPLIAAFGANLDATAMAGIHKAICKVPPVMMCNPEENDDNSDTLLEFDGDAYQGIGIRLIAQESYAPGSFGFLQSGLGAGANPLLASLGWNTPPGNCVSAEGVETKPGMNTSVIDGLNTRFDVPGTGTDCPDIDSVDGVCWPSLNSRKDLIRGNACSNSNHWSINGSNSTNYQTRNYRPTSPTSDYPFTPQIMGHPRDKCHAVSEDGVCSTYNGGKIGRIGTGDWDINAYWRANYGANYSGQISEATYGAQPKGYPTRYQVYRWEADNYTTTIANAKVGTGGTAYAQPQAGKCLATPSAPYGVPPTDASDRRRITVAVLNCSALEEKYGGLNSDVLEVGRHNWVNVFLVEPSLVRTKCSTGGGLCNDRLTDKKDVYVEIIGKTDVVGGAETLIKDVPYLIE